VSALRDLIAAWSDADRASPRQSVVIAALILVLILVASLGDGPT
jgi:hypothetical protein